MASPRSATRAGYRLSDLTAVSPAPRTSAARPSDTSSTVAIDPAREAGWRVTGLSMNGASLMEDVIRAARVSMTYTSHMPSGPDGWRAHPYPSASARATLAV